MENLGKINDGYTTKNGKPSWDNESYTTSDLYEESKDPPNPVSAVHTVIEVDGAPSSETNKGDFAGPKISDDTDNNGYTLVGTGGKVRWEFVLTPNTTDTEIEKTPTTKLLHTVQVMQLQIRLHTRCSV